MKKTLYLILLSVIIILSNTVNALDSKVKKKYSFLLLTEDHEILNQKDLAHLTKNLNYEKFSEKSSGLIYWQCFPRENISVTLEDMGYSAEEFDPTDTIADLKITAYTKPNIFHTYYMRRAYPISAYQEHFTRWQRLMKGQKYVCIAGSFGDHKEEVIHGIKREENSWTFDRIKTKKGMDSYFIN
ncbi:MAG: hypothetical protein H0U71_04850 [Gammaproteobacteria bacterium]|nr:hypothetical protein [Gammaproteobacteria bacterium]